MSAEKVSGRKPLFIAIDLFAGCGGLSHGLEEAGFSVLAAIERDPVAAATYKSNHRDVHVLAEDITSTSAAGLRRKLKLRQGELDLLAGCPPCQGYSSLRTRNGYRQNRDVRNGLVREMLRFTKEFLPMAVMMENVPGLLGKKALSDLTDGLVTLGYNVTTKIQNARFFGVPQRRRRLMLLAGLGFPIALATESKEQLTVRAAIGNLPPAGFSGDALHDLGEKRSDSVKRRIALIPKNGGSRIDLDAEEQLQCHKDCDGFKDVYGRMAWDTVSPTITGGCFNPSKGRFLHPEENRCITMREAALLQGFPPRYRFDVAAGKQVIAMMIGNALPPEFVKRHAVKVKEAIIAALDSSVQT